MATGVCRLAKRSLRGLANAPTQANVHLMSKGICEGALRYYGRLVGGETELPYRSRLYSSKHPNGSKRSSSDQMMKADAISIRTRRPILFGALIVIGAWIQGCSWGAEPMPAGSYRLDKAHASMIFRIDHMGFSHWTGRMSRFNARRWLDPAHPVRSRVEATVDTASLEADNTPPHFLEMLWGPDWLDASAFPQISFRSTQVLQTGVRTAQIK